MGYARDRAVSGGELDGDGHIPRMYEQQFAPSSTNVRPGLGLVPLVGTAPKSVDSGSGVKTFVNTPVASLPFTLWKPPVSSVPVVVTPVPVSQIPVAVPPSIPAVVAQSPAQQTQTVAQSQANADTLAQQAAQAQAAGNPALAKQLSAQSVQWGDITSAIQNAVGAIGGASAPNTMGVASDSAAPVAVPSPISKEVVYAGLGVVALLLLLRH
jgi:hypothetical protein